MNPMRYKELERAKKIDPVVEWIWGAFCVVAIVMLLSGPVSAFESFHGEFLTKDALSPVEALKRLQSGEVVRRCRPQRLGQNLNMVVAKNTTNLNQVITDDQARSADLGRTEAMARLVNGQPVVRCVKLEIRANGKVGELK